MGTLHGVRRKPTLSLAPLSARKLHVFFGADGFDGTAAGEEVAHSNDALFRRFRGGAGTRPPDFVGFEGGVIGRFKEPAAEPLARDRTLSARPCR